MPKELCWHTSFFFYNKVSDSDLFLPLHFFFLYLNILGLKCIVNLLYNERKGSITRSAHLRSKWDGFFPLLKYVFKVLFSLYWTIFLLVFTVNWWYLICYYCQKAMILDLKLFASCSYHLYQSLPDLEGSIQRWDSEYWKFESNNKS